MNDARFHPEWGDTTTPALLSQFPLLLKCHQTVACFCLTSETIFQVPMELRHAALAVSSTIYCNQNISRCENTKIQNTIENILEVFVSQVYIVYLASWDNLSQHDKLLTIAPLVTSIEQYQHCSQSRWSAGRHSWGQCSNRYLVSIGSANDPKRWSSSGMVPAKCGPDIDANAKHKLPTRYTTYCKGLVSQLTLGETEVYKFSPQVW